MSYTERAWGVSGLTPGEKLLLLALARYADEFERVYPGEKRLSEETGLSKSGVKRCLGSLRDKGLVDWKPGVGRVTNAYELTIGRVTQKPSQYSQRDTEYPTQEPERVTECPQLQVFKTKKSNTSYYTSEAPAVLGPEEELSPSGEIKETEGVLSGVTRDGIPYTNFIRMGYPEKEGTVPAPGFEHDDESMPRRKVQVDDTSHLAGVGRIPTPPKPEPPRTRIKPHTELWLHFTELALPHVAGRGLTDQMPDGRIRGEFKNWLAKGVDFEVLKISIDRFFADKGHLLNLGTGPTLWERYRSFYVHNQASFKPTADERVEAELEELATRRARLLLGGN